MALTDIFILGGGVCGVASALAISKALASREGVTITVFELREAPATLGGPVNLTPSAQRHLDRLGVLQMLDERGAGAGVSGIELFSIHSGKSLGCLNFAGDDGTGFGGYKGRRVSRRDLLLAMLDAAEQLENVQVVYGKKVTGLRESAERVHVSFEDGETSVADLVLGCDGIHSNTRMQFVEPDRVPVYTGISTAQGYVKTQDVASKIHFKDTGMNMSRMGSLLATYHDPRHEGIYLAAVTEAKENLSRDGWKAKGADQETVRQDLMKRFGYGAFPCVREMVAESADWFLFPVYILPPGGKWCTERVILLGDAAHAMPPQGESIGFALEDALLFARILEKYQERPLRKAFQTYERLRRKRIDEAHLEASRRWESVRDSGYLRTKLKELFVPWWLWWSRKSRDATYMFDAGTVDIPEE